MNYILITMDNCPYCDKAKEALTNDGASFVEVNVMDVPELGVLPARVGRQTLPLVLKVIGGFDELDQWLPNRG